VRRRTGSSLTAALTAALVLSGCAGDETEILPPEAEQAEALTTTFDASLEPAAAVLALVPEDVATLTVTDFEQVRLQMGLQDLTTEDPRQDQEAFWSRAEAERPLLSTGMLRPVESKLGRQFGLSQLDVAWEAHLYDDLGNEVGFVLAFRDGTDLGAVGRALDAGLAGLEGATLDAEHGLVTSGTTDDGDESWAADASLRPLVGPPANATYVDRGCVDDPGAVDLDGLEAYSVQFEGTLATARLGEERMDLFTRMRMGEGVPEFEAAYDGGVADPLTGRIGYVMTDPPAAASMALAGKLPFAACP
jgi:hypothetical protein